MLLLWLVSFAPAHAGHYELSGYSGGSYCVLPFPGVNIPYGITAGGYGFSDFGGGMPSSLKTFDNVTATFTWQPDPDDGGEAPPDCVIVEKDCTVFWQATAFFPAMNLSTQGSSGLTDYESSDWTIPVFDFNNMQIGLIQGGMRQGVLYDVMNSPGSNIVLTCSPSVDVETDSGAVTASLSYNAAVFPVKVQLSGVRKSGSRTYALTGAEVTASLFIGIDLGLFTPPPLVSPTTYQWTPAGNIFKDYITGNVGMVVYHNANDKKQSTFSFFTRAQGGVTIRCDATFLATVGNRTFSLPVNASATLTSVKPASNWEIVTGRVALVPGNQFWRLEHLT